MSADAFPGESLLFRKEVFGVVAVCGRLQDGFFGTLWENCKGVGKLDTGAGIYVLLTEAGVAHVAQQV